MPGQASIGRQSLKTETKPETCPKESYALADLLLLRQRLRDEGEVDLLAKIAACQEPLVLKCQTCGTTKEILLSCKRKWCPCCAKRLAAIRSSEMSYIVERMRWPLFVTLTMKNVADLSSGGVRKLRRSFGKLRHRKLWKSCVRGGVAAVEVTNIGNGWHPHLHAVVDCQWLASKTPPPQRRDSVERKKELFKLAAIELEAAWSKCLGQETSSVKVKRASRDTIAREVCKYTVKCEDLVLAEGRIGDLIRALDSCRLLTTFGQAHGQCVKDIRIDAKARAREDAMAARDEAGYEECCPVPDMISLDYETTSARLKAATRRVPTCLAV